MDNFEEQLKKDLHQFLQSINEVDERMPECPDVEDKWEELAKAYIPDGIREFQAFPSASLGWMMYIGMAVAKMWDTEWEIYAKVEDLYAYMRDKRGYDAMDEYRPDRVVIHPDGAVDIIDYKFGEPHPSYQRQVQRYMNLYRAMGHAAVSGWLWYLENGTLEPIS